MEKKPTRRRSLQPPSSYSLRAPLASLPSRETSPTRRSPRRASLAPLRPSYAEPLKTSSQTELPHSSNTIGTPSLANFVSSRRTSLEPRTLLPEKLTKPLNRSPEGGESPGAKTENAELKLQRIILKLQEKVHVLLKNIEGLKQQIETLSSEKNKLQQTIESNEEGFEILTLEKEFLDEKNQDLEERLAVLSSDYERLKDRLETLQKSKIEAGEMADPQKVAKLKRALQLLQEQSEETELELAEKVELLAAQVDEYKPYKERFFTVQKDLDSAKEIIEDLQAQLDTFSDSMLVIEALGEKNEALAEENSRLKQTVEELEDLRDLTNDLEEAHLETERQLKRDIEKLQKSLAEGNKTIEKLQNKTESLKRLLDSQKASYIAELDQTRSELSIANGEEEELIQAKIDELKVKIARISSEKNQLKIMNGILLSDLVNSAKISEVFRSFAEDSADKQVIEKCSLCLESIMNGKRLLTVLDEVYNLASTDQDIDCKKILQVGSLLKAKALVELFVAQIEYQWDDDIDYSELSKALLGISGYVKEVALGLAIGEISESYEAISEHIVKGLEPLCRGLSVESAFSEWSYFPFKNAYSWKLILQVYLANSRTATLFLGIINKCLENGFKDQGLITLAENLSRLTKAYRSLLASCEKKLRFPEKETNEVKDQEARRFIENTSHLDSMMKSLYICAEKIERENNSFFSEIEEKDYNEVFEDLSSYFGSSSQHASFVEEISLSIQSLSLEMREIEPVKSFELYYRSQVGNFNRETSKLEDISKQLLRAQESLTEKQELISQLSLRIEVLKEKLSSEAEKDRKIDGLVSEVQSLQSELNKQEELVRKLSITTSQQASELRRKAKNLNLIGEFASIFEEKEFVSNLALILQLQSHRDLVSYLSIQVRHGSIKNTGSIFGMPLSFDWLVELELKLAQMTRYGPQSRLISLAKRTRILKPNQPGQQWQPKASTHSYYVATVEREYEEYKKAKRSFIGLL